MISQVFNYDLTMRYCWQDPSKVGYVECSKCRGWLNGFTRLRYHIKMMHNPYNPQPMHYMNQSSEDNALMPDNIGFRYYFYSPFLYLKVFSCTFQLLIFNLKRLDDLIFSHTEEILIKSVLSI